jgi:hypothetical protein
MEGRKKAFATAQCETEKKKAAQWLPSLQCMA